MGLVPALLVVVLAQTGDTAAVFGTVTDSQGFALSGAAVRLTSTTTAQTRLVTTNTVGSYLLSLLPVGSYSLAVEQAGFRKYERTGLVLQANDNVKVDVVLPVGDVKTSVVVEADAPQVEARSSTLKETIDRARVLELPLNGRNPADLALLIPGVVNLPGPIGVASNVGVVSLTVNGSRNNNLAFTLDGAEHVDPLYNYNVPYPFPDAVQEFSIQTANLGVEHGNSLGGSMNVVTKSGTNQIHGSGFWFLRNTALNATNFFSHQQDQLKRNQAGFTLGGPIVKNKLFAFGGYQQTWIRQVPGNTRVQTLTAAERRGDFSSYPSVIYDPLSGNPFPKNIIPQNRLSPAAVALNMVSPLPGPDGFANFTSVMNQNIKEYIGRVDYAISEKQNLMFRVLQNNQALPFNASQDNIYNTRSAQYADSESATISHNLILSPSMIAHTQLTGVHVVNRAQSSFNKTIRDFGVNDYAPSNDIFISFQNSASPMRTGGGFAFQRATEQLIHDWTWTKGAHTFTWGVQLDLRQYNEINNYHMSGFFAFDGHATAGPGSAGYDRADFMLGLFSAFDQDNGELENRRSFTKGFYFGDVWRLTPRLTVNFGLRYEPYSFFTDTMNRNQTFDLGNYQRGIKSKIFLNAPPGLLYTGDAKPGGGTIGKSVMEPDNNNLAPRFGFAWDPFGDGKTSVRSGFGIYYDTPALISQNDANDVAPFSYDVQFTDGLLDDPYRGRQSLNRFPITAFNSDAPFPDPLSTIVVDRKYVTAYSENWNLTVEREVAKDLRLRVAYVGTGGRQLKSFYDQNAPIYNPQLTLAQNRATIDPRRPVHGYQSIARFFFGLNSSYNALQVSADKRYSHGFTAMASYTWSKTLDYVSQNSFSDFNGVNNPFNFFSARGLSDQNRPHVFTASVVWDVPSGISAAAPRLFKAVAEGWKLSSIASVRAGRPFSIFASNNPTAGAGSAFVDLMGLGNPVLDAGRSKGQKVAAYFDRSRFSNPLPNTYGTLGRNVLIGPGFANVDASLVKAFHLPFLGEAGSGQLRFESFNVLNRTNLGLPNASIGNPKFGQILTTDGDPRIMQVAVKVAF
ncbi:MAG: carboxypeptidase regulatory-like domain-containing protein [Bryobacteraceae bacterium]